MDTGRPRFEADRRERAELAERFFGAFRDGDVDGLRELLAADVAMLWDSGGKAPQSATGIIGRGERGSDAGRDRRAVRPDRYRHRVAVR